MFVIVTCTLVFVHSPAGGSRLISIAPWPASGILAVVICSVVSGLAEFPALSVTTTVTVYVPVVKLLNVCDAPSVTVSV